MLVHLRSFEFGSPLSFKFLHQKIQIIGIKTQLVQVENFWVKACNKNLKKIRLNPGIFILIVIDD